MVWGWFCSENDAVFSENDAVLTENDAVLIENDAVFSENDAVFIENDAVFIENDAVFIEIDGLNKCKDGGDGTSARVIQVLFECCLNAVWMLFECCFVLCLCFVCAETDGFDSTQITLFIFFQLFLMPMFFLIFFFSGSDLCIQNDEFCISKWSISHLKWWILHFKMMIS